MRKRQAFRKPLRFRKKKSILKTKFFSLILLLFVFIGIGAYFLLFSKFFRIEQIIISGNEKVSQQDVVSVIEEGLMKNRKPFIGKNIFLMNLNKIKKDILEQFPQIGKASLSRSLPHTLKCSIQEREQATLFCQEHVLTDNEGEGETKESCFFVDKEGVIFESIYLGDNFELPIIKNPKLESKVGLGDKVLEEKLISDVLKIFSGLKNLGILTKEALVFSEDRINIRTLDDWQIYFNPQEDLNWQLTKLRAVLDEYIPLERRKDLEYIELRFGNLAPFKYQEE